MKHLALLALILSLSFCKSVKIEETIVHQNESQEQGYTIQEKMEIIPRQMIHFAKDEAGVEYLKLLPGEHTVFKYKYRKFPKDTSLKDAVYTQYIYFEMPGKIKDTELKNDELKSVNLTAQVFAFRNATLHRIDKGSLKIKVIDKQHIEVEINLDDSYKTLQKKHIKQLINIK